VASLATDRSFASRWVDVAPPRTAPRRAGSIAASHHGTKFAHQTALMLGDRAKSSPCRLGEQVGELMRYACRARLGADLTGPRLHQPTSVA
jgi:hypothetical protein